MTAASAIISACAQAFGVAEPMLRSPCRKRHIVRARQAAYWLLRVLPTAGGTERSFPQIGRLLDRDHGSVIHGYQMAENLLERDAQFTAMLADACEMAGKAVPEQPLSAADLPHEEIVTIDPGQFRHVKARNEGASGDRDARMRLHGTFALGRALQAAMAERDAA